MIPTLNDGVAGAAGIEAEVAVDGVTVVVAEEDGAATLPIGEVDMAVADGVTVMAGTAAVVVATPVEQTKHYLCSVPLS